MANKYEVANQLTGISDQADTFQEILAIKERNKQEYFATLEGMFNITVYVDLPDGSVRQGLADSEGNLMKPPKPFESWVWNETDWTWNAPVPKPVSLAEPRPIYRWDEENKSWVEQE